MPFFGRKRNNDPKTEEQPKQNGSSGILHTNVTIPPLTGFVSPEGGTLRHHHRQDVTALDDTLIRAREPFLEFLKQEGLKDLLLLWEKSRALTSSSVGAYRELISGDVQLRGAVEQIRDQELFDLKCHIEKAHINVDLSSLSDQNNVDQTCLQWVQKAQSLMLKQLNDEYLPLYLNSKFHIKSQVDYFTNRDNVTLDDILRNQNALFYFMEFVDQEDKREILEYLLSASNFTEQFHKSDDDSEPSFDLKLAQSDAMVLYEKYISLQATHPLGFRDEIRCEVERRICSQDEIAQCFVVANDEAVAYLHFTCLETFLKSSLYLSFLSDLINSLSSITISNRKTHKRSESTSTTCSSSSTSLTSPNNQSVISSLLPRERENKLSIGRVNSLGKFESDTDLELLKHETGLAKTMKKLVNFDEKEKAKEELAWQVAAMIVNEVTSITMGTGDSSSNNS